jgi:glycosyltransferase involved in cell wall biosynthesis
MKLSGSENMTTNVFAVSVLIPTYNYGHYLPQAIDSVLSQTHPPVEIVVADDGSTDETAEIVARCKAQVVYLRFEHRGIVALRNAMLDKLQGEWILNLDADDWIEPDFIEKAVALIAEHAAVENLAFVYADRVDFGAYERKQVSPEFDAALLKKKNYIPFDALIRRDVACRFGFDPAFEAGWEDYDFLLTLVENGYSGVKLPEPPVHCRVHPASRTSNTLSPDKLQRLMKQIVAKHSGFFSPEEATAAVEYFAPEAVLRHRICEHFWAKQYLSGLGMLVNVGFTHPSALFSATVLKRMGELIRSRVS